MPKINKKKVAKVLENMGKHIKDDKSILNVDGDSLNLMLLNQHPKVIEAREELVRLGVTSCKQLMKLGFIPASFVLEF